MLVLNSNRDLSPVEGSVVHLASAGSDSLDPHYVLISDRRHELVRLLFTPRRAMAVVVPSTDPSITKIIVDDQLTDLITYSTGWSTAGVQEEFAGTTHTTTIAGSTATFPFNGTNVFVFGTIGPTGSSPPNSTYFVDGGQPTSFTGVTTSIPLRSIIFFQSQILPNGPHTLVITYTGGDPYFLDYIQFYVPSQNKQSPFVTAGLSSTSTSTVTTTPSASPTLSASQSSSNVPVIVGAVLGAFVAGMILTALVFLCFRRDKKVAPTTTPDTTAHSSSSYQPEFSSSSQPAVRYAPSHQGTSGHQTNSDVSESGSSALLNPPAYSKRREALGS